MADSGERSWWRRSRIVAITAVTAGGVTTLLAMLFAPLLNAGMLGGLPFGMLVTTLLVPAFVVIVIFWAVERQRAIDRAQGFES
jgi:putative solute:sodium symporter small subunit